MWPGAWAAGGGRAQPAGRLAAVPAGFRAARPSAPHSPPPAAEARCQASHSQQAPALPPLPPALLHSCGGAPATAAEGHVFYQSHGQAHAAAGQAKQGGNGGARASGSTPRCTEQTSIGRVPIAASCALLAGNGISTGSLCQSALVPRHLPILDHRIKARTRHQGSTSPLQQSRKSVGQRVPSDSTSTQTSIGHLPLEVWCVSLLCIRCLQMHTIPSSPNVMLDRRSLASLNRLPLQIIVHLQGSRP